MTRTVVENPDEHGVSPAIKAMLDVLPYAAAFFGQDLVCRHANPQFKLAVALPDLSGRPSVSRLLGDWVEAALRERWGGNIPEDAWDCRLNRPEGDGSLWFGRLSGHAAGLDESEDGFVAVLESGQGMSGNHEWKADLYRDPLTGLLARRSFL
ncbi:MAG TPA: hypothetical protein VK943_15740, partial [Arenibaculum sp.]|nr:hypothetical protein [Arenibaculum sp.]